MSQQLLPEERVHFCMTGIRKQEGKPAQVEVWYSPRLKASHYAGLMVCGSVWICPICSAKITERRREELARGIESWPGSVFMATFTLQHTREDKLLELKDYLRKAYRALKSGRSWQAFEKRLELAGSVSALEVTVSKANGWHPHLHVLFFSHLKPDEIDTQEAQQWLQARFSAILAKDGRYSSAIYGVRVEKPVDAKSQGDEALKKYVSKWGLEDELTKSPVKAARAENGVIHYSPFQLLDLCGEGQKWAGVLFQEYAHAMKGTKQLVWTKGLRSLLGLDVQEQTDEELAEEVTEIGNVPMAVLTPAQWRLVLANDARAELLDISDTGDIQQVNAFLAQLGIRAGPIPNYMKGQQ